MAEGGGGQIPRSHLTEGKSSLSTSASPYQILHVVNNYHNFYLPCYYNTEIFRHVKWKRYIDEITKLELFPGKLSSGQETLVCNGFWKTQFA